MRKFISKHRDDIVIVILIVLALAVMFYVAGCGLKGQVKRAGDYAGEIAASNWPEDSAGNPIYTGDEL